MLIHEVSQKAHLTRKAVEYYIQQGLVTPAVGENGYRQFSLSDLQTLKQISALRKLDITVEDIQKILVDSTKETLQGVLLKKELSAQRDLKKNDLLKKLASGAQVEELKEELLALEQSKRIIDRLMDSFPGYYGRFIAMNFARFLDRPVQTQEQKAAYRTVVSFLDSFEGFEIPAELMEELEEHTSAIGIEDIESMMQHSEAAYEDPEKFLEENHDAIQFYIDFKKTEQYRQSAAGKLMQIMRAFCQSSGYNDVFLPAMMALSPAYAKYYQKIEVANQKLIDVFPEAHEMT